MTNSNDSKSLLSIKISNSTSCIILYWQENSLSAAYLMEIKEIKCNIAFTCTQIINQNCDSTHKERDKMHAWSSKGLRQAAIKYWNIAPFSLRLHKLDVFLFCLLVHHSQLLSRSQLQWLLFKTELFCMRSHWLKVSAGWSCYMFL